jgi:hypothetical protein
LPSNNYFPGVSRFHDFCGIAAPNFRRRFQLSLAQLELQRPFPEKREIARQRPIFYNKAKGLPVSPGFETARKQGETADAMPWPNPLYSAVC